MFRIFLFSAFIFLGFSGFSQCFQQPVTLNDRLAEASLVVEGKVDSSYCVWNNDHTLILSIHKITIFKYFKGASTNKNVTIVTQGGELDGQLLTVEPELHLHKDDIGVFLLKLNVQKASSLATTSYIPVAAEQGFIEYDLEVNSASGVFDKYAAISANLYTAIMEITGKGYYEVKLFTSDTYKKSKSVIIDQTLAPPSISGFSPISITAGTNSTLTINGNNFGAAYSGSAKVEFKNANDGGSSYTAVLAANIVSWSDVQIQVIVPSGVGTGTVRVTNATAESIVSGSNITINYNQTNVAAGLEPNLINENGTGGYTYVYSTGTANNGVSFDGHANAKVRFESALATWRCNTGFNVIVGANTAISTTGNDGSNVVMFDNDAAPLPAGVLGTAYSFYSSCGGPWRVTGIDIVFKRDGFGATWYFGANAATQPGGTSDFETVALHELGHNHQLGHTISPGAVMHFAITSGTNNRSLNPTQDLAGGVYVMTHSNLFAGCARTGMVDFNCGIPPVANFSGTPVSSCNAPIIASFTDLSTNAPTSWSWTFTGATPSSSTAQNPTNIQYTTPGTYAVTLTATNANGSDSETKTEYITIDGGAAIPLATDFQGAFTPTGFSVVNLDGGMAWQQSADIVGLSGSTTKAAFMNSYNYNYNINTTDDLVTLKYNIISYSTATLKFDVAYERFDANNYERLQVLLSTDCGLTFPTIVYNKSGADADGNNLSTKAATTLEFSPTLASHWRLETVDLTPYAGSVVVLKFRVTNGYGNNLFIDNINMSGVSLSVIMESFTGRKSGSAVKLNWKTLDDDGTELYVIERSHDGKYFESINQVNSSLSDENMYQVMDPSPGSELVYYRLKQIHKGIVSYSSLISVDMSSDGSQEDLKLFPNPVNTGELFYIPVKENEAGEVRVHDLAGKQMEDINFSNKESFMEISGQLKPGVYLVEYVSGGIVKKGRILVK
jgi:PKD repeat protein